MENHRTIVFRRRRLGAPGRRSALSWLLLGLAATQVQNASWAADPLVVDSALLRLTQQIDVPARAQGVLSSMSVAEGDAVKQGTPLALVDDAEPKLLLQRAMLELELQKEKVKNDVAIRTAQKAVDFHRTERDRLDRAARDLPGSVSASELEQHRFNAAQAELKLEEAQHDHRVDERTMALKQVEVELGKHNVDIRRIASPLNGVVVDVLKHAGEWVEPGEKVLRIVSIDRLRAEGLVHVSKLPPKLAGAPVTVTVDLPDKGPTNFNGKIVFVSPEVNPVNGLTRVWAEIDNTSGILKPGLRPQMKIHVPTPAKSK